MREPQFNSSSCKSSRQVPQGAGRALCLALLLALPGGAQQQQDPGRYYRPMHPLSPPLAESPKQPGDLDPVEQERRRALNAERRKSMVSDTSKLLKLAAELNAEVSSANPDSLSLDQLRKLAQIEKLAHGVKEKMKLSPGGS